MLLRHCWKGRAFRCALIGGMAVQIHTQEPRSTRDIDLAVLSYAAVPHDAAMPMSAATNAWSRVAHQWRRIETGRRADGVGRTNTC